MDSEANFWFAKFHIAAMVNAFIADPSNLRLYPDEVTLIGQQLISWSLESRLDVIRMDFVSGFENFVEAQYGLSWDQDWTPTQTLDTIRAGTQFSVLSVKPAFRGGQDTRPVCFRCHGNSSDLSRSDKSNY